MKITSWRIIKAKYRHKAFKGEGARIYGGRWNTAGFAVVYTAESLSLATLEIIVHLDSDELLYHQFVKIPISFDSSCVQTLRREKLPKDWDHLPPSESTQVLGCDWVKSTEFAVLKVPSSIIKEEHNYLINPGHPDFNKMLIGEPQKFDFDLRLIEKKSTTLF